MVSLLLFFSNVVFVWAAYNQAHTKTTFEKKSKRLHAWYLFFAQDCFLLGNHEGNKVFVRQRRLRREYLCFLCLMRVSFEGILREGTLSIFCLLKSKMKDTPVREAQTRIFIFSFVCEAYVKKEMPRKTREFFLRATNKKRRLPPSRVFFKGMLLPSRVFLRLRREKKSMLSLAAHR